MDDFMDMVDSIKDIESKISICQDIIGEKEEQIEADNVVEVISETGDEQNVPSEKSEKRRRTKTIKGEMYSQRRKGSESQAVVVGNVVEVDVEIKNMVNQETQVDLIEKNIEELRLENHDMENAMEKLIEKISIMDEELEKTTERIQMLEIFYG